MTATRNKNTADIQKPSAEKNKTTAGQHIMTAQLHKPTANVFGAGVYLLQMHGTALLFAATNRNIR